MNISKLYQLKKDTEKAISIQRNWERQQQRLLALPAKLGFDSMKDLVAALGLITQSKIKSSLRGPQRGRRKKRQKITEETRQLVKTLVAEGKTLRAIAKETNLSVASVQNIKTQLRLTKHRKAK